jgi:hypothetical protein
MVLLHFSHFTPPLILIIHLKPHTIIRPCTKPHCELCFDGTRGPRYRPFIRRISGKQTSFLKLFLFSVVQSYSILHVHVFSSIYLFPYSLINLILWLIYFVFLKISLLFCDHQATGKITQLSVGPLLAQAIYNIHNKKSISALFK